MLDGHAKRREQGRWATVTAVEVHRNALLAGLRLRDGQERWPVMRVGRTGLNDITRLRWPAHRVPTIGLLTCVRADRPPETTTMDRRSTWPVRSGRMGADAKMRTGCDKEFS